MSTIIKGSFKLINRCKQCNWYATSAFSLQTICPDCGGKLKHRKGRYIFKEIKKGIWPFRFTESEIIDVEWLKEEG